MSIKPGNQSRFFSLALFSIPAALFVLVLAFEIPSTLSQPFHDYSFPAFLALISLYYLAFRLPDGWNHLAAASLTLLIFGLSLSYQWTSGFSNNLVIGGLLPYKDGFSYYASGTQMLLNGMYIPAGGLQAAGRPLFPGLLASLLFFGNQNLQWVLAALVGLAAITCYWAARQVQDWWGNLAAAIYATLLYFYIQPLIGTTLSELPGLIFGCLGFIFLSKAANGLQLRNLTIGIILLMAGISIRAGAFFIFPGLIIWAGWAFRGEKRFSYRAALMATLTTVGAFLLMNVIYPRLVVAPGGATFANFAYALYGQVLGGAGWHRAIADLQTHDPNIVYGAAFDFFLKHPFSLVIGIAKSYRDFFLPGDAGIFSFYPPGDPAWPNIFLWLIGVILLTWGCIRAIRERRSPLSALLAAAWVGIFLSIPFLPPIDGGRRFYAGSMAFFFALPMFGLSSFFKKREENSDRVESTTLSPLVWAVSAILFIFAVIFPPILRLANISPKISPPICSTGQKPFVTRVSPGSYIDLVPNKIENCGLATRLCMNDFKDNGVEKRIDDFYQKLVVLGEENDGVLRIVPGINQVDLNAYYFVGTPNQLPTSSQLLSGCAFETRTTNQRIYLVQTTRP
jgi:hypothetical protein